MQQQQHHDQQLRLRKSKTSLSDQQSIDKNTSLAPASSHSTASRKPSAALAAAATRDSDNDRDSSGTSDGRSESSQPKVEESVRDEPSLSTQAPATADCSRCHLSPSSCSCDASPRENSEEATQPHGTATDSSAMPEDDEDDEDDLFNFDAPLKAVPYMNPPETIFGAVYAPPNMEKLNLLGLTICFDLLAYCFTLLPLKCIVSMLKILRKPLGEITPQQYFAMMQAFVVVFSCVAVDYFDVSLTAYNFMRTQMNWAKLYSSFQLFSALDTLIDQVGRRVTGSMVWCIINRQNRLIMLLVSCLYVTVHSSIILVQITSVHVALDQGSELLSLMLSVQLVELKAAMISSITRPQLFKMCLNDVSQRFRWCIMLLTIYFDKLSRYTPERMATSMPVFLRGACIVWLAVICIDGIKHSMYALTNPTWRPSTIYTSFINILLEPFENVTKLGLEKTKYLSQHFDFISLSYSVIAIELFWVCLSRTERPLMIGVFVFSLICFLKFFVRYVLRVWAVRVAYARAQKQLRFKKTGNSIAIALRFAKELSKQAETRREAARLSHQHDTDAQDDAADPGLEFSMRHTHPSTGSDTPSAQQQGQGATAKGLVGVTGSQPDAASLASPAPATRGSFQQLAASIMERLPPIFSPRPEASLPPSVAPSASSEMAPAASASSVASPAASPQGSFARRRHDSSLSFIKLPSSPSLLVPDSSLPLNKSVPKIKPHRESSLSAANLFAAKSSQGASPHSSSASLRSPPHHHAELRASTALHRSHHLHSPSSVRKLKPIEASRSLQVPRRNRKRLSLEEEIALAFHREEMGLDPMVHDEESSPDENTDFDGDASSDHPLDQDSPSVGHQSHSLYGSKEFGRMEEYSRAETGVEHIHLHDTEESSSSRPVYEEDDSYASPSAQFD